MRGCWIHPVLLNSSSWHSHSLSLSDYLYASEPGLGVLPHHFAVRIRLRVSQRPFILAFPPVFSSYIPPCRTDLNLACNMDEGLFIMCIVTFLVLYVILPFTTISLPVRFRVTREILRRMQSPC